MNNITALCNSVVQLQLRMNALQNDIHHVGEYKLSTRSNDFHGWLLCDGRTLEVAKFQSLYSVIGDVYGTPGSDYFTLPDCRGKVLAATDFANPLGTVAGSVMHALTIDELPAHTHDGTSAAAGTHTHTASNSDAGTHTHTVGSNGSHTHSTNATGGTYGLATADGNNTSTATDATANEINVWTTPVALNVDSAGAHGHSLTSDGSHTHVITVDADGEHSHTFTTNPTGSNLPFSIVQPTLYGANVFIYSGSLATVTPLMLD